MTSRVYGGASNRKYQLARGGLTVGKDDKARARSRVEIGRSSGSVHGVGEERTGIRTRLLVVEVRGPRVQVLCVNGADEGVSQVDGLVTVYHQC
jgi:hypothetical protein